MSLVIPTIFTAVNKFSSPVGGMANDVSKAANKMQASFAKIDASVNKTFSIFSEGQKQLLGAVGAVAIAAKVGQLIGFSADSVIEYEKAIASFRTIVSDLNDQDFSKFKSEITSVAKETKRSTIEVAQSFEMIAGINSDFAKTADGLGAISKAAITLSKASGADLATSASNLVGIMNQFEMGAKDADRAINVLAAGQAVGAANITQTAEAFVNFGSTAKGANITLEQSVALIQTLGAHSLYSEQAGTKLRGSILRLQASGVGYKNGLFNINDALAETKAKYDKLATAKQKDAYLDKVFGAENISTGRILLSDIERFKQFSGAVAGTSEAYKAAEINGATLANAIYELKAAWVTALTSSDSATTGLNIVKSAIQFLTEHLNVILGVISLLIAGFIAWKAVMLGVNAVLLIQNIRLGINSALMGESAFATWGNNAAYIAFRATILATAAAQWVLNNAILASGIGALVIGVGLLGMALYKAFGKNEELNTSLGVTKKLSEDIIGGIKNRFDLEKQAAKEAYLTNAKGLSADKAKIEYDKTLAGISKRESKAISNANIVAASLPAEKVQTMAEMFGPKGGDPYIPINSKKAEQDAMVSRTESTQKQNVSIDINDKTGRASVTSSNDMVPVKVSSTLGNGFTAGAGGSW